ncbi:MAG: hypothetical protein KJ718_06605 [Nanoarchaeota archaeon]|nr:hypothetical protein [Nanoarchaeota archaeon]MBU1052189.1 hypothetical protein [Nanoarchaeota archaeon]
MRAIILTIFILLLLFPLASSIDTEITVKTLPAHTVYITPTDQSTGDSLIAPQKTRADYKGEAEYTFSGDQNVFGLLVVVKWFEERKFRERLGPYPAGEPIYIELLPDDYVDYYEEASAPETPTVPETDLNESDNSTSSNDTVDEEPENSTEGISNEAVITGGVIRDSDSYNNILKISYYVIGAILVFGVVAFFVVAIMRRRKSGSQYGMKPVKLKGPPPGSDFGYNPSTDVELSKIRKEISFVEKEIDEFRKSGTIHEAQRKLAEKRKVLEEMKKREG